MSCDSYSFLLLPLPIPIPLPLLLHLPLSPFLFLLTYANRSLSLHLFDKVGRNGSFWESCSGIQCLWCQLMAPLERDSSAQYLSTSILTNVQYCFGHSLTFFSELLRLMIVFYNHDNFYPTQLFVHFSSLSSLPVHPTQNSNMTSVLTS